MAAAASVLVSLTAPVSPAGGAEPSEAWGYITVADGVRLRYTTVLPDGPGPFPVALILSPYADGVGPTQDYPVGEDPLVARALLDAGYAVVGVNMRGTGCSSGRWDLFEPASDGYEAVEWAAAQPWSSGAVGMFGISAPGMVQLTTASAKPPHLKAITPADIATDLYRDVAYPGGIMNTAFVGLWTVGYRPAMSHLSAIATAQGDTECLANIAARQVTGDLLPNDGWEAVTALAHPFEDDVWAHYGLSSRLSQIAVPVLSCQAWQDDQVGSRVGSSAYDVLDKSRTWLVFTNGHHGTCDDYPGDPFGDLVVRFFDHYVRGIPNGFDAEPHVSIWHETAGVLNEWVKPAWVTTFKSWPVPVKAKTLYLRSGRKLDTKAPGLLEGADSYVSPLPSASAEDSEFAQPHLAWKVGNAPGGSVAFTTPALAKDLEVFGPASADLWIKSTGLDTDLQVTLSEVRSDGQEVYVQRGWLRASHRKLDAARSTALRPYQTHRAGDAQLLVPLAPTFVRVEINPFGHVFRAGSALRITVEAPIAVTGMRAFQWYPVPALNSVIHDGAHPSRLVLGAISGGKARAARPNCDTVLSQPCRADVLGVPKGLLDLGA